MDGNFMPLNLLSHSGTPLRAPLIELEDRWRSPGPLPRRPATRVSAVFESAMDVLHFFVPQQALAECHEDVFRRPHAGDIVLADPKLIRDPALERHFPTVHFPTVFKRLVGATPRYWRTTLDAS